MTYRLPPDVIELGVGYERPDELEEVWNTVGIADPLAQTPAPDPARIQAIRARLQRVSPTRRTPARIIRFSPAIAAAIAVLVLAGVYLWQRPVTVSAPTARELVLPDNSEVTLSAGSRLSYTRNFRGAQRSVYLNGEAFFEIKPNIRPFLVETFNADVSVPGTSFLVAAWPQAPVPSTTVHVASGVVEVGSSRSPGQRRRLSAGETVRINGSEPSFVDITPRIGTPFLFVKTPLGEMFDAIEERFGVDIIAREDVRSHVHNFKQDAKSAEQILGDLCRSVTSMTLRYRPVAGGYEVFRD